MKIGPKSNRQTWPINEAGRRVRNALTRDVRRVVLIARRDRCLSFRGPDEPEACFSEGSGSDSSCFVVCIRFRFKSNLFHDIRALLSAGVQLSRGSFSDVACIARVGVPPRAATLIIFGPQTSRLLVSDADGLSNVRYYVIAFYLLWFGSNSPNW